MDKSKRNLLGEVKLTGLELKNLLIVHKTFQITWPAIEFRYRLRYRQSTYGSRTCLPFVSPAPERVIQKFQGLHSIYDYVSIWEG